MSAETKNIQIFRLQRLSKVAVMALGFLLLLLEIRFQHRAALIDDWRPWMPIVFCNLMIYLIPIAGIFWHKGGKQILVCAYFLTMIMGALGLYFHSEGHLIQRLMELTRVWLIPPHQGAEIAAHYPPVLAPLAFIGLGSIGLIFCFDGTRGVMECSAAPVIDRLPLPAEASAPLVPTIEDAFLEILSE